MTAQTSEGARVRARLLALGSGAGLCLATQLSPATYSLGARLHHAYRVPHPRMRRDLLALPRGVVKRVLRPDKCIHAVSSADRSTNDLVVAPRSPHPCTPWPVFALTADRNAS